MLLTSVVTPVITFPVPLSAIGEIMEFSMFESVVCNALDSFSVVTAPFAIFPVVTAPSVIDPFVTALLASSVDVIGFSVKSLALSGTILRKL